MTSYNRFIVVVFGIVLMSSTTYAQMDSVYSFYPLQKGNTWQYKEIYFYRDLGSVVGTDTYYVNISISGDTLLNNGKRYAIIERKIQKPGYITPGIEYERIDSLSLQVFCFDTSKTGLEYLMDSLRAPVGSFFSGSPVSWIYFTEVVSIDSQYYFGIQSVRRTSAGGFPEFGHFVQTLNQGIGLTTQTLGSPGDDMSPGSSSVDTLTYAKIDGKEYGTLVSVPQHNDVPYHFSLDQNYPNPFNPTTTIFFELPSRSIVTLKIFDVLGREVSALVSGEMQAGTYTRQWNAANMSSGIYFYRLVAKSVPLGQACTVSETKKLLLLK
jgi:Secretion system C-terminal sorting domain